jgi:[acyl-carrier-protein] S-malonyltransferase
VAEKPKIALVFPGQGSQQVGMGYDIYSKSAWARDVFDEADSVLGFPLSSVCFNGPEALLRQTVNAQPAILTVSIALLRAISEFQEGHFDSPAFVAGHSLGEYSALVASGVVDFATSLRLARERGQLMQEASDRVPSGMMAVIGLAESEVREICSQSQVEIANINSPGQIVISGDKEALKRATVIAKEKGARRVIPLEVSGAFHSRLMQSARDGMAQFVSELVFQAPLIPIIANTTATPLTTAEAVKAELVNQLCHPIQWQGSVEYMIERGATTFIEIGPGKVLSGLIRWIDNGVRVLNISGWEDLRELIEVGDC